MSATIMCCIDEFLSLLHFAAKGLDLLSDAKSLSEGIGENAQAVIGKT